MNDSFLNREYLIKEYVVKKRSFSSIANDFGTYANKIRRAAIQFGIKPRDKSSAQKEALKSGRHGHPTKGTSRKKETKEKISDKVSASWKNLSDEEYKGRVKQAKKQWKSMTVEEKRALRSAASEAVRKASVEGSKLEKFMAKSLREAGYVVQFHRKGLVLNDKLEVDLFLPELRTAIEIDGPSHFFPIWGEKSLSRNLRADAQKTGLLLSGGFIIIRIKHLTKHLSNKYMRDLSKVVLERLEKISEEFPKKNDRFIEIEV